MLDRNCRNIKKAINVFIDVDAFSLVACHNPSKLCHAFLSKSHQMFICIKGHEMSFQYGEFKNQAASSPCI